MAGDVDAVVVGGGVAGLIAARDLGALGYRAVLLEARGRLGGRAWCRPFGGDGVPVELGGAWFDAAAQAPLREEADRYGVPIGRATEHRAVRWFTGGELRNGLPVPRDEVGDFERVIVDLTIAARRLATASAGELHELDAPLATWLDRLAPTPAARDFLFGWTSLMSGADPNDHPALGPLGLIAHKGNTYAFYSDLVDVFPSGTSSLAAAIAADVRGEVRLGSPVQAIRHAEEGVTVFTAEGALKANVCVLAVPINVMARIEMDPPFAEGRRAALVQGQICRPLKVWMLATGVPDRMLAAGWGTPFYWLSAEHRVEEPADAQLVVAFALHGSLDPADRAAVERALRVYAPEARVLAVDHHDWVEDPWARGGWMSPPVGWASAGVHGLLREPHGRVLLAGSDVASAHAGWIAGAVASGRAVAADAVALVRDRPSA